MNRKFTRFSIFLIVAIVMGTVVFFSACKKDSAIINNDNNAANSTPQISLSDNEADTENDNVNSDTTIPIGEQAPSSEQEAADDSTSTSQSTEEIDSEENATKNEKSTLLIYMIGSDLEARCAAGTDDLTELENSGINIDKNNVVVFAGGSPMWHNDITDKEKINVLELTKDGFTAVTTMSAASMGTADSLTEFLNYGYENYPSDSFGLVMWNHGNGPNIGYGKDMLFDNDSLTLAEMKSALAASPFNSSNKFAWVGFDACLMSTAELVCVWDDYANYLVASQEIEPSFGWNYSIFEPYGTWNTKNFIANLADGYLSTCLEYYNKKGYANKDITLACIDLSYGTELENSINTLFSKALTDVESKYNDLVKCRVSTRALGRATTGSEYDLIDLNDMAVNLAEMYPEETAALSETIDKMVLKNGTNALLCSGLSIYYPFYNKYFFENSWAKAYENIGVFDSYREYLTKYQQTWLLETDLEKYEKSPVPQKLTDTNRNSGIAGTYILPLSPEQNASFAEARYYILEKHDDGTLHFVISSSNVQNHDGILHADISGKAIYAKDNEGSRIIPLTTVNDTVGDITRFTSLIYGVNKDPSSIIGYGESKMMNVQFALNNATEELSIMSILPDNPPTKADEIPTAKLEDCNLEDWDECWFPRVNFSYITRDSNGIVLPFDKWILYPGKLYSDTIPRGMGLYFAYEPIGNESSYYVIFEITDTLGGKYCSEPLLMETELEAPTEPSPDDIVVKWENGSETEIYTKDNISVKLEKQIDFLDMPEFVLSVENNNDFPISLEIDDIVINGVLLDTTASFSPIEKSVSTGTLFSLSLLSPYIYHEIIDEISSIRFNVIIRNRNNNTYLVKNQTIQIDCSENISLNNLNQYLNNVPKITPYKGAMAEKQVLHQSDDIRISLLLYGTYSNYREIHVLFENLSDKPQTIKWDGICTNGITDSSFTAIIKTLPGKTKYFKKITPSVYSKTEQIESVSFRFSGKNSEGANLFDTPDGGKWIPIHLKQSGKDTFVPPTGEVVFDENDIKIITTGVDTEPADNGIKTTWDFFVENNSGYDIYIRVSDENNVLKINAYTHIGAHQCAFTSYSHTGSFDVFSSDNLPGVKLKFQIFDYDEKEVIFYDAEPVTLYLKKHEEKNINIDLSSESTIFAETDKVRLYLEKTVNSANQTTYSHRFENEVDIGATFRLENIYVNENIAMDYSVYSELYNVGTKSDYFDFEALYALGEIDEIESINGELTVLSGSGNDTTYYMKKIPVEFTFSGEGKIDFASSGYSRSKTEPYLGALAENQVIYQDDKIVITLLYFGKNDVLNEKAYLCFENISDNIQKITTNALSVNSITKAENAIVTLNPHKKTYKGFNFSETWSEDNYTQSIEALKFHFTKQEYINGAISNKETFSADASLKEKGKVEPYVPGENVIYDKDGIKIVLNEFRYTLDRNLGSLYGLQKEPTWYFTVINNTDQNITLDLGTDDSNYISYYSSIDFSTLVIAAHERTNCTLSYSDKLDSDELRLRLYLSVAWPESTKIPCDDVLVFPIEEEKEVSLYPFMDAMAEEQVLWETEEFKFKLEYFGNNDFTKEKLLFSLENFTDKSIHLMIYDFSVNSYMYMNSVQFEAKAYSTSYMVADLSELYLDLFNINSIETLEFGAALFESTYYDPSEGKWFTIDLAKHGKADEITIGNNVLFENDMVKIVLDGFEYFSDGRPSWNITAINKTDKYLTFSPYVLTARVGFDSEFDNTIIFMTTPNLGPHKTIKTSIYHNMNKGLFCEKLTLKNLSIYGFPGNKLYTFDETLTLYRDDGVNFTKTKTE